MDQVNDNPQRDDRESAETFGNVRNTSERFRSLPNSSEDFGNLPKSSEDTRQWRWTLTVKDTARHFEDAGVPRSEHTITNWCQLDQRTGTSRLDCHFDERERRWFIDPQSVRRIIGEEQDRQRLNNANPVRNLSTMSQDADEDRVHMRAGDARELEKARKRIEELEAEVRDKEITNRVKDSLLKQVKEDREMLFQRIETVHAALNSEKERAGFLSGQLHQIGAPAPRDGSSINSPSFEDTAGERPASETPEAHYSTLSESESPTDDDDRREATHY